MSTVYGINKREDFDLYFDDFRFTGVKAIDAILRRYVVGLYILLNYDIVHLSYDGGFICRSLLGRLEPFFLHLAGAKIVMIPYGSDFYRYSSVTDPSWRHALLTNYPTQAKKERQIQRRVEFFNERADFVVTYIMLDGSSRWDMLPVSIIAIDEGLWPYKKEPSQANGKDGTVVVLHTPNHRGAKGTEFLIRAVRELKSEGYVIDLRLLEGIPNDEVQRIFHDSADILVEQLVAPGYAVSAMEGMATGLPVLSNLTHESWVRLFTRYSYLSECPIVPTNPETIKENLRLLVEQPELRLELGKRGRAYVEKYHSELTTQIVFSRIYDKIWYGKNVDLINYFHPIIGQYNKDYEEAVGPSA